MMDNATDGRPDAGGRREASGHQSMSGAPFDLFIEAVEDYAIFMLDPEGHVMTWNRGAERIKGYTADDILGEHFSTFYSEADRRRKHPREELKIAAREGRYEEEGWRLRKDGSRFWANVVITAVRDRSGRLVGFGKVTRDLTERLRQEGHERELAREQAARIEAEAANRGKSEFLATMSHELRTPLNAIMGYVDLMEMGVQGPINEDQSKSLERIRKSSKHLLRLINDVLNFTRVQAGHLDYDIHDVLVDEILEEVEPLIMPQFGAKGIAFTCESPGDGLMVRADPTKVRQILLNLLTNAQKFTPANGKVCLWCEWDDAHVRTLVRDTGRGIPARRLEKVFDPFVQIDRHLREVSQKGVGLGLAISRDIARAMEGDLTVESEVGRGSTFTLELPGRGAPERGSEPQSPT